MLPAPIGFPRISWASTDFRPKEHNHCNEGFTHDWCPQPPACLRLLALEGFRKDPLPGYEDEHAFRKAYLESVRKEMFFLPDSPICFVSAHSGYAIKDFLQVARDLDVRLEKSISTSALNKLIGDMFEHRPPAKVGGKRFKIFYAVQVEKHPFRIKLFCNREHKLDEPYRRYLEKGIQKKFGLSGCPLKFSLAGKEARYKEEKNSG